MGTTVHSNFVWWEIGFNILVPRYVGLSSIGIFYLDKNHIGRHFKNNTPLIILFYY